MTSQIRRSGPAPPAPQAAALMRDDEEIAERVDEEKYAAELAVRQAPRSTPRWPAAQAPSESSATAGW